ncbi:hypothetical protein, partial [Pseudomonas protegens]
DLTLRVGGQVNPYSQVGFGVFNGALVNLRGHAQLSSAALGSLDLHYGAQAADQSRSETRAFEPQRATLAVAAGGMTLMPGDATFSLSTRGDLVLQTVADPGRAPLANGWAYQSASGVKGIGQSWFSLWTERSAIDLYSAGGNLTPLTRGTETDMATVYPPTL